MVWLAQKIKIFYPSTSRLWRLLRANGKGKRLVTNPFVLSSLRRRLVEGFILISFSFVCFASDSQEMFLKANNLYAQKQYKEACKLYDAIKNKGPAVWYNMGNCVFKQGNFVDSILYWSKAKRDSKPRQIDDIEYNISVVREKLGNVKTKYFLDRFFIIFDKIFFPFSLFGLQLVFLLFWFVCLISWARLKTKRYFIVSILIFMNLFLAIGLIAKYRPSDHYAIVYEREVAAFSGPDEKFHTVGKVVFADEVHIAKQSGNWYKIDSQDFSGWILANKVKEI